MLIINYIGIIIEEPMNLESETFIILKSNTL